MEDYYKTLESITADDVKAAADKFLVESGQTTVVLLPAQGGVR
jgi:hypothetical protein